MPSDLDSKGTRISIPRVEIPLPPTSNINVKISLRRPRLRVLVRNHTVNIQVLALDS